MRQNILIRNTREKEGFSGGQPPCSIALSDNEVATERPLPFTNWEEVQQFSSQVPDRGADDRRRGVCLWRRHRGRRIRRRNRKRHDLYRTADCRAHAAPGAGLRETHRCQGRSSATVPLRRDLYQKLLTDWYDRHELDRRRRCSPPRWVRRTMLTAGLMEDLSPRVEKDSALEDGRRRRPSSASSGQKIGGKTYAC